ncbi:MAG TPA: hypothetical protein PKD77_02065 [Rudaea sp.]|jgi:hypothetical protein|nr:hypothetical protein [Rudaea sp.]
MMTVKVSWLAGIQRADAASVDVENRPSGPCANDRFCTAGKYRARWSNPGAEMMQCIPFFRLYHIDLKDVFQIG